MFGNMMGKMKELQKQMEEIKTRLDSISVEGVAGENEVRVICNGNRKVIDVIISNEVLENKEAAQDLIVVATNRALEQAEQLNEAEMKAVAGGMMPGLGGMFK